MKCLAHCLNGVGVESFANHKVYSEYYKLSTEREIQFSNVHSMTIIWKLLFIATDSSDPADQPVKLSAYN